MITSKFTGLDKALKEINDTVKASIKNDIPFIITEYLKNQLDTQIDASGKKMPEKKESTKKYYKKYGWNTEKFLIRTGESTKLTTKNISNGIEIEPKNPDILKKFIPSRVDWMTLNQQAIKKIVDILMEDLRKKLE